MTILADDLSGALDTAVVFRMRGARTLVRLDSQSHTSPMDDGVDVQAWNVDDRHALSTQARSQVLERLRERDLIYMKVDSTLRGPVGAQIDTILQSVPRYHSALVCPAYPENGRAVMGGRIYVEGQPLEHTASVRDPENPMASGNIVEILRGTSRHRVQLVRIEDLSPIDHPAEIYVVDAKTSADLHRLAQYITAHPSVLPVGSAGLARALAEIWWGVPAAPYPDVIGRVDQILALVGSLHPTTREQVVRAATSGSWVVQTPFGKSVWRDQISHAPAVILTTPMDRIAHAHAVLEDMVRVAAYHVARQLARGQRLTVVATGGDTALAFFRHLAVGRLWPKTELAPGVVLSVADVHGQPLSVITKSGAFGGPEFFEGIYHRFTNTLWKEGV